MASEREDKISHHECIAIRELKRDGYTTSEIAFMFESRDNTIIRHANKDCRHNGLSMGIRHDLQQEYSDAQLKRAYLRVYDLQPYQIMSQKVYDDFRPDDYPAASTIIRRFGSWIKARELVHD